MKASEIATSPISYDEFEGALPELIELYKLGYEGISAEACRNEEGTKGYLKWLIDSDPNGFFVAKSVAGRYIGLVATHIFALVVEVTSSAILDFGTVSAVVH